MKNITLKKERTAGTSPFSKRFHMRLKNRRKTFFITLLFQLLGIPLMIFAQVKMNTAALHVYYHEGYITDKPFDMSKDYSGYAFIHYFGLAMLAAAVLAGIFTAVKNFSYLHGKAETDLTFSLPANRKDLFLADYLSGLFIYVIPYISVVLLTLPVWLAKPDPEKIDLKFDKTADLIHFSTTDYTLPAPEFILKLELFILIVMIFIYSFTVFITVCCGTLTGTIANLILSNASVIMFLTSFRSLVSSCIVNQDYDFNSTYELERITPAGAVYHIYRYMCDDGVMSILYYSHNGWAVWCSVSGLLCAFAAYVVFKKRKAEDTGKTVTVPALFCTVSALITAVTVITVLRTSGYIYAPFSSRRLITFFTAAAIAFIVYMFLLAFNERRIIFLPSLRKLIIPAASVTISVILYLSCAATKGFGGLNYIPDTKNVLSAGIHLPVSTVKFNSGWSGTDPVITALSVSASGYSDTETIGQISNLNRSLNEDTIRSVEDSSIAENYSLKFPDPEFFRTEQELSQGKNIRVSDDTIYITYLMKNGKLYSRKYIPFLTDYSKYDIFKNVTEKLKTEMKTTDPKTVRDLLEDDPMVSCASTEFMEKLYGCRYHSFISSIDDYPDQYTVTGYSRDLLSEILLHSYYSYADAPVFYSEEDCYVIHLTLYSDEDKNKTHTLPAFFLPAEYSDLYNKFLETADTEEIIWYRTDENGNATLVFDKGEKSQ